MIQWKHQENLCSILKILRDNSLEIFIAGANGDEVTPVPIPNTEVKLISVENTWLATAWEDRAVPAQRDRDLKRSLSYIPP